MMKTNSSMMMTRGGNAMGTNYYARVDPCQHCGRSDEQVHIGKSSVGWQFSFHATESIRSKAQWMEFLQRPNIRIYDEYGEFHPFDWFKDLVEGKQTGNNWNHCTKCKEDGIADDSFLDEEGFSMSPHEFS